MNQQSDLRLIKKYPNRRLYDTVESRYITLADVRKLIIDRIGFQVIDKKTQNDLTRGIVLQVFAEHWDEVEATAQQKTTGTALLMEMVRMQGTPVGTAFTAVMLQQARVFRKHGKEHVAQLQSNDGDFTAADVNTLAQKMLQDWQKLGTATGTASTGADRSSKAA